MNRAAGKGNLFSRIENPKFKFFQKTLAAFLMTGFLGVGTLARAAATNNEQEANDSKAASKLILPEADQFGRLFTPEQMYKSYIQQGAEYAQKEGDENRQKAMEFFAKAINEVGVQKALGMKTTGLDEKTEKLYSNALKVAQFNKMMDEQKKKEEEKKGSSWYWWVLGLVGAAGLGYLGYKLLNEKTPVTAKINKINLEFDVYNHTQGYITHYSKPNIDAGSSVTIDANNITGISGVLKDHIIVRKANVNNHLGELIAFNKSGGSVTFTAPQASENDVIILLNNTAGGSRYDLIDTQKYTGWGELYYNPNMTYDRKDIEERTGPDQPLLDAISRLKGAYNTTWVQYADITKVDSGAMFGAGYGGCDGNPGVHWYGGTYGDWAGVNPDLCKADLLKLFFFIDEIYELTNDVDDLAGTGTNSGDVIEDKSGNITPVGKDIMCYEVAKSSKTWSSTATALNAMTQGVDMTMDLGNGVKAGLKGKRLNVDYKGKNMQLEAGTELVDGKLRNSAAMNFTNGKQGATIAMLLSPTEQVYSAQGSTRIGKLGVDLGVRGTFDINNHNNALGLTVAKNTPKANISFSYDTINSRDRRANAFSLSSMFDLGGNQVQVVGAYTTATTAKGMAPFTTLSLGANASLEKLVPGLSITGSFNQYKNPGMKGSLASLGLMQQVGPGRFVLSIMGDNKKVRNYEISYLVALGF